MGRRQGRYSRRLREHIKLGQRIEKFRLSALAGAEWKPFAESTTIGYQRLLRFPPVTAQKVRIEILESRLCPTLSDFSLFHNPELPAPVS